MLLAPYVHFHILVKCRHIRDAIFVQSILTDIFCV